jgi:L-seryl-tRNA(Ser) seleniumtransferase
LAALQDVALAYLRRDGRAVPFWRMATTPVDELRRRADAIVEAAGAGAGGAGGAGGVDVDVEVVECESTPGGGSAPGTGIPSVGLAVAGDRTAALRAFDPPVIARVAEGRTVLDLRTVDPSEDEVVAAALGAALGGH